MSGTSTVANITQLLDQLWILNPVEISELEAGWLALDESGRGVLEQKLRHALDRQKKLLERLNTLSPSRVAQWIQRADDQWRQLRRQAEQEAQSNPEQILEELNTLADETII